jgi:hypothetical protein
MSADNRKSARRRLATHAVLRAKAAPIQGCIVRDISESGARIAVVGVANLPDEFDLILARNGTVSRHCHVVWRGEKEVGVKFGAQTRLTH